MQAISISFFRFEGIADRLWAFSQMQFSRGPLKRIADIGFLKMFGTGTGEGFTPVPNFGVYALLATWPSLEVARERIEQERAFRAYRYRAAEAGTLYLRAIASRGLWDGKPPFDIDRGDRFAGPIAVLTRATLKKRHVLRFWSHTPDISQTVREQTHLLFKIGMGEVPWFQQVTFSVWDDAEAMKAFAYRSRSHGAAIKSVRDNGWFREELYARFAILHAEGQWDGKPLLGEKEERLAAAAA